MSLLVSHYDRGRPMYLHTLIVKTLYDQKSIGAQQIRTNNHVIYAYYMDNMYIY